VCAREREGERARREGGREDLDLGVHDIDLLLVHAQHLRPPDLRKGVTGHKPHVCIDGIEGGIEAALDDNRLRN